MSPVVGGMDSDTDLKAPRGTSPHFTLPHLTPTSPQTSSTTTFQPAPSTTNLQRLLNKSVGSFLLLVFLFSVHCSFIRSQCVGLPPSSDEDRGGWLGDH